MPNRLLREGILTSERVNMLGPHAEVFYRRLMSVVDDYGRYHASPGLLRAACYPLAVDKVREADISRLLAEVQKAGLIALYAVAGKPYLEMCDTNWKLRAKKSKFPSQNSGESQDEQQKGVTERADTCAHVRADAPGGAFGGAGAFGDGVEKDISGKRKRFVKPTLGEVQAYCRERGNNIDAQRFLDHYDSNGWKVGRTPMKDWRATVRTWERNQNDNSIGTQRPKTRDNTGRPDAPGRGRL